MYLDASRPSLQLQYKRLIIDSLLQAIQVEEEVHTTTTRKYSTSSTTTSEDIEQNNSRRFI